MKTTWLTEDGYDGGHDAMSTNDESWVGEEMVVFFSSSQPSSRTTVLLLRSTLSVHGYVRR